MESGQEPAAISFAATETLGEVDIANGEVRVLVDGDEPLEPMVTPIARIVSLGDADVAELTAATRPASRAVMRIPDLDVVCEHELRLTIESAFTAGWERPRCAPTGCAEERTDCAIRAEVRRLKVSA